MSYYVDKETYEKEMLLFWQDFDSVAPQKKEQSENE
jgi:predicted carbohydrate-binding protein with CBM5 and CBM33 domain